MQPDDAFPYKFLRLADLDLGRIGQKVVFRLLAPEAVVRRADTVEFVRKHVPMERIRGFLMAAWGGSMMPQNEAKHLKAMDIAGAVREDFVKS